MSEHKLPITVSMYCATFGVKPEVKDRHTEGEHSFMVVSINYLNNSVAWGQLT
jgi:hypothetical protein